MKLYCYDYVNVEDKMYFSAINVSGLFEYSNTDNRIRLLTCFDKEETEQMFLHSKILKYKSSLWLVPNNSGKIYEYDLEKEILNSYCIPGVEMEHRKSFFLGGEIVGEKLYLFPCRYVGILVFDLEKRKIDKMIDLDAEWREGEGLYSYKGAFVYENKIFISNMNKDVYEIIDLVSNSRKKVYLTDVYNGITHMCVHENNIVIIGKNGKIGVYSIDGEKKYDTQFQGREYGPKFFDVCNVEGVLYLTETDVNKIAVYDTVLNEKKEYSYPVREEKEFKDFWAYVLFIKYHDERVYFQSAFDGYIYCIENGKIRKMHDLSWDITDKDIEKVKLNILNISKEQYGYDLKMLINCL